MEADQSLDFLAAEKTLGDELYERQRCLLFPVHAAAEVHYPESKVLPSEAGACQRGRWPLALPELWRWDEPCFSWAEKDSDCPPALEMMLSS